MTIKLHCFGESGNAYKAALSLELSGLEWQAVYVDFFAGETRTPEYRARNSMGEVPYLRDGDLSLSQSGVIQDYVVEKSGKLGGSNKTEAREVLRWTLWDNHKLSGVAGPLRFLMNFVPEDKQPKEAIAFLQGRIGATYKTLNANLEGRDWLVGDGISNADISCCGYLFYTEPFGFERKNHPNIDAWLDRIAATPGWKHPYDLMPGSPADRV